MKKRIEEKTEDQLSIFLRQLLVGEQAIVAINESFPLNMQKGRFMFRVQRLMDEHPEKKPIDIVWDQWDFFHTLLAQRKEPRGPRFSDNERERMYKRAASYSDD